MPKDRTIGVRIESDTLADLERIAAEQDRSVGWVVRKAIANLLESHQRHA